MAKKRERTAKRVYTASEAAELLGISSAKVRELINAEEVDARFVGNRWEIGPRGMKQLAAYARELGRIEQRGNDMIMKLESKRTKEVTHLFVNLGEMTREWGAMKDLADRASVSRPYLHRVVDGSQDPSVSVVGRIAKAVGVEIGDLFVPPEQFGAVLARIRRNGLMPGQKNEY